MKLFLAALLVLSSFSADVSALEVAVTRSAGTAEVGALNTKYNALSALVQQALEDANEAKASALAANTKAEALQDELDAVYACMKAGMVMDAGGECVHPKDDRIGVLSEGKDCIYKSGKVNCGSVAVATVTPKPVYQRPVVTTPTPSSNNKCAEGWEQSVYDSDLCFNTTTVSDYGQERCPEGFTLTPGGRCAEYTDKDACPPGWEESIYNKDMCFNTRTASAYGQTSCSSGYTLTPGGRCVQYMRK